MKFIYVDTETGGLNTERSALLQLAGIIEIDGKEVDTFNYYLLPHKDDLPVEKEAIEIHRLDPEKNPEKFDPNELVYTHFISLLDHYIDKYNREDKFYFIGYNCLNFDAPIVRHFFLKNNSNFYGSYFHNPSIDVMALAAYAAIGQRQKLPNFKLLTVAESLGLTYEEKIPHDAEYDVKITKRIFDVFRKEYPY